MTIFILDTDPSECTKSLDDRSLGSMIKKISQVLCKVHYYSINRESFGEGQIKHKENMGFKYKKLKKGVYLNLLTKDALGKCEWSKWTRKFKANYTYLFGLLKALHIEYEYRDLLNVRKKN